MRFALGAGWNNIYDEDEKRIRKVEKRLEDELEECEFIYTLRNILEKVYQQSNI